MAEASTDGDGAADAPLAVVILAGGDARRMGGGKPLRPLGSQSLLDHAVARAKDWSDRIFVAVRSPEQVGDIGLALLRDVPGIAGPIAGLAAAASVECSLLLTIPCDMPFLPHDLALRLGAGLGQQNAALAVGGGQIHPVCGLWRSAALARLPGYLESGRRSLIGFAETVGFCPVEWPGEAFANINTLDELRTAERRMG